MSMSTGDKFTLEAHQNRVFLNRLNELAKKRHEKDLEAWEQRRDEWNQVHGALYGKKAAPFQEAPPPQPPQITSLTQEDDLLVAFRNEIWYGLTFNMEETKSKHLPIPTLNLMQSMQITWTWKRHKFHLLRDGNAVHLHEVKQCRRIANKNFAAGDYSSSHQQLTFCYFLQMSSLKSWTTRRTLRISWGWCCRTCSSSLKLAGKSCFLFPWSKNS